MFLVQYSKGGSLSSPDGHNVAFFEEYHWPFAVRRYWQKPGSIDGSFDQYRFFLNLFAAIKKVTTNTFCRENLVCDQFCLMHHPDGNYLNLESIKARVMKKAIVLFFKLLLYPILISVITGLFSFQKKDEITLSAGGGEPSASYPANVLDKWMALQIRLMSGTPATFNGPFVRIYSYSGLAAFESVLPGISKKSQYRFSTQFLNQAPSMPAIDGKKKYHWLCSLNAAMAFMNRSMFPATNAANKIAIDSLENALQLSFAGEADAAVLERSAAYGLQVAQTIYNWAETDGYRHAGDTYIASTGPGKWVPTPPGFAKAVTPYWGRVRPIVAGSTENADPPGPIPYSEDSSSAFYKEAKRVYDISQNMTEEQKNIALFWKEINPGLTAPGHWLNILRQILQKGNASLDKAVFCYALTGMALNDAWISTWKTRYVYNVLRPVTYIRDVMKKKDWLSFAPTPPHPEYTSGFAAMAAAVCESLATVFGSEYQFTDHTYDYAGMKPRSYYSFQGLAKEAGDSKVFGGIHFAFSVEAGLHQGTQVARNIAATLLCKENFPHLSN